MASRALLSIYLAQELLALRLALEEGCGPGPCPPRELSFTKSSQAARAVREVLTAACSSQWEQLRGLSSDEDGLQKVSTEGGCPLQVTHCSPIFPHRPWPPGLVPIQDQRMETVRLVQGGTQILEPPPCNDQSTPLVTVYRAKGTSPRPPSSFRGAGVRGK